MVSAAWVINQVTPCGGCGSLVNAALNWNVDFLVFKSTLVGTLAVVGVRVTVIPESRLSVEEPDFFGSAADVAVMTTLSTQGFEAVVQLLPGILVGSGTTDGAV